MLCVLLCALCAFAVLWLPFFRPAAAQEKRLVRVYFPNGEFVLAEPALSAEQRARGLMFREDLAADRGMLFFFDEEALHPFWMKNVRFPIDILWLDREKMVVHIARTVPPCRRDPCPTYAPLRPSIYVLELRAGRSDQLGVKPGDRIEFSIR